MKKHTANRKYFSITFVRLVSARLSARVQTSSSTVASVDREAVPLALNKPRSLTLRGQYSRTLVCPPLEPDMSQSSPQSSLSLPNLPPPPHPTSPPSALSQSSSANNSFLDATHRPLPYLLVAAGGLAYTLPFTRASYNTCQSNH